jgi:hypothetical protein
MKTFIKVIAGLVLLFFAAVFAIVGYYFFDYWKYSFEWNQKITVAVETPVGLVSGSAVQHIEWVGGARHSRGEGGNASGKTQGEAVVLDLGANKYLFALLQGDGKSRMGDASTIAQFALCKSSEMSPGAVCFSKLNDARAGTSAQVQPGNMPMLVTFADINDPKTVKLVDTENLAATFGEGFALKSISVEITDEQVSAGAVERGLGWEKTLVGSIGKETNLPYGHILNQINDGSFAIGKTK